MLNEAQVGVWRPFLNYNIFISLFFVWDNDIIISASYSVLLQCNLISSGHRATPHFLSRLDEKDVLVEEDLSSHCTYPQVLCMNDTKVSACDESQVSQTYRNFAFTRKMFASPWETLCSIAKCSCFLCERTQGFEGMQNLSWRKHKGFANQYKVFWRNAKLHIFPITMSL